MKTIMAIAAHPDDIEFFAAGTISDLISKGYKGVYIIATSGDHGFKIESQPRNERIRIREDEQIAAAESVGVHDVIFLKEKDGFLEYKESLRKKIALLIKKYQPEIIFTFDPANREFKNINLNHRDHRVIGELVFDAVFAAKNKFMYKGNPWKVDSIYFFGSGEPNIFIPVNLERKFDALSKHKSQYTDFSKLKKVVVTNLMHRKNCEAFRVVKIVQV
jgi:LmbE family N-acetylglucosaminyl deacetylase